MAVLTSVNSRPDIIAEQVCRAARVRLLYEPAHLALAPCYQGPSVRAQWG